MWGREKRLVILEMSLEEYHALRILAQNICAHEVYDIVCRGGCEDDNAMTTKCRKALNALDEAID